jgi:gamma-glutamylputrescine oxidase
MNHHSFWESDFIGKKRDITIIGAGIVGLSTAISLAEAMPHLSIKIIERGNMPYGASTKNAGFSCFGSISELLDDIESMGVDRTMDLVKLRWQGLQKLRSRVGDISLKYLPATGVEIFRKSDGPLQDTCIENISYCNELMYNTLEIKNTYKLVDQETLPGLSDLSIVNQYEGTINPMHMMDSLHQKAVALGVKIHYGINVNNIDTNNQCISTDNFDIDYKYLIVCTNGFTKKLLPNLEVIPARNQVLITKPIENFKLDHGYHLDKGYVYFRSYEGRILLGGGRNIGGDEEYTDQHGNTETITNYLHEILDLIHPRATVDNYWSGILGIGPEKFPICEWVDDNILCGVRMGGMGVAIGSQLGEIIADMAISKFA